MNSASCVCIYIPVLCVKSFSFMFVCDPFHVVTAAAASWFLSDWLRCCKVRHWLGRRDWTVHDVVRFPAASCNAQQTRGFFNGDVVGSVHLALCEDKWRACSEQWYGTVRYDMIWTHASRDANIVGQTDISAGCWCVHYRHDRTQRHWCRILVCALQTW